MARPFPCIVGHVLLNIQMLAVVSVAATMPDVLRAGANVSPAMRETRTPNAGPVSRLRTHAEAWRTPLRQQPSHIENLRVLQCLHWGHFARPKLAALTSTLKILCSCHLGSLVKRLIANPHCSRTENSQRAHFSALFSAERPWNMHA